MRFHPFVLPSLALFLFGVNLGGSTLQTAGAQTPGAVEKVPPVEERPDPLKRRLSDNQERARRKETVRELKGEYKTWLDQDVRWIITDEETKAFKSLSNDEERDQFIEQFWMRRNPNPESPENEFRDEHYARIAYANEHFAAGKPGWLTDRGHIYIAFGKPDSIDSHPSGGNFERPMEEGGGNTSTFPFETWHYRYLARRRRQHRYRVRRHVHVRRLPCNGRPLREGCAEAHAGRRTNAVRADGSGQAGGSFQWRRARAAGQRTAGRFAAEQAVRSPDTFSKLFAPRRSSLRILISSFPRPRS